MKRILLASVVLAAALAALTTAIHAAPPDAGDDDEKAPKAHRPRHRRARHHDPKRFKEHLMKVLEVTAEQQPQVDQILETQKQALENWRKENGEAVKAAVKKLRDARKSGDADAAKEAKAELEKLRASRRTLHENLMKQLGEVLTEEQVAKAEKFFARVHRRHGRPRHGGPLGALRGLELTEEQKKKVKAILDQARTDAKAADDRRKAREIMKAAFDTIREDVLTDEQKAKLGEMRKRGRWRGPFGRLDLTDEQKTKIKEIIEAAREAGTPRREAFKKIVDEVLTDEQKEKLHKHRPRHRRPRKGGPRKGKLDEAPEK